MLRAAPHAQADSWGSTERIINLILIVPHSTHHHSLTFPVLLPHHHCVGSQVSLIINGSLGASKVLWVSNIIHFKKWNSRVMKEPRHLQVISTYSPKESPKTVLGKSSLTLTKYHGPSELLLCVIKISLRDTNTDFAITKP